MNVFNFLIQHERIANALRNIGLPSAMDTELYRDYATTRRLNPNMKKKRAIEIVSKAHGRSIVVAYRVIKRMESLVDSRYL